MCKKRDCKKYDNIRNSTLLFFSSLLPFHHLLSTFHARCFFSNFHCEPFSSSSWTSWCRYHKYCHYFFPSLSHVLSSRRLCFLFWIFSLWNMDTDRLLPYRPVMGETFLSNSIKKKNPHKLWRVHRLLRSFINNNRSRHSNQRPLMSNHTHTPAEVKRKPTHY